MVVEEDDDGVEWTVYYHSWVLNDAQTRYSQVEKLCICLYLSCTKLKCYIKSTYVFMYSDFDVIKHM